MIKLDTPFFRPLASGAIQKLAETLWDDLCDRYTVPDVPTYFLLQQLAVSQWQARELGLEQCGQFAEQTDPNSRIMLTLSRERRAECRLVAQLKRELKENLRGPQNQKPGKPDHSSQQSEREVSDLAYTSLANTAKMSNISNISPQQSTKAGKTTNIPVIKRSTPANTLHLEPNPICAAQLKNEYAVLQFEFCQSTTESALPNHETEPEPTRP